MTDLSEYAGTQFTNWLSQGTIDSAPSTLYVTVLDSSDNDLAADLSNARNGVSAGSGWNSIASAFLNDNDISLGEATTDLTDVTQVALYDSPSGGNLLARYEFDDAPVDISEGTELIFGNGDITFDIIDVTQ